MKTKILVGLLFLAIFVWVSWLTYSTWRFLEIGFNPAQTPTPSILDKNPTLNKVGSIYVTTGVNLEIWKLSDLRAECYIVIHAAPRVQNQAFPVVNCLSYNR
jgi:hypothetical protein